MSVVTKPKGIAPAKFETELTEIDAGILKDVPVKTSLTINGTAQTQPQIDAQIKGYLATFTAAETAKQQYQTAVAARVAIIAEARDYYLQLKKAVIVYFGAQSPQLADFGLTPAKAKVPKTSEQKAIIAVKAKITRAARGTTSKKQKAAINPGTGTPLLSVGAEGSEFTAPTVVSPSLPGNTAASSTSTTASNASAPAPAGSGAAPAPKS